MTRMPGGRRLGFRRWLRAGGALVSFFLVETVVFAVSLGPAALILNHQRRFVEGLSSGWMRVWVALLSLVPFYLSFALVLMILSAVSCRLTGWRTPHNVETRLEDLDWPLLDWVRYSISIRIVDIFAGALFRSTPLWTFYMRLNGAKLGRRVHINSLEVTDHNLLELGDHVVVGGGVHLSGHTVEEGVLKTAPVRLERDVTVGVGSVVNIGVVACAGSEIGALSYVPKYSTLEAGCAYAGVPVHKIRESSGPVKADPIGRLTNSSVA